MPSSKSRSASKRRTPNRSNRSRVPMNEVFEMPSSSIFNRVSRWLTRKNKSKSKSPRVLSIGQYSPRPSPRKGGSRKNRTRRHSRKH